MQKIQGFTEAGNTTLTITGAAGTITRKVQGSFPSCTVTVFNAGTVTLATIYADNALTPKANPFTASASGTWFFYAANGVYDVNFSGGGIAAPFTIGGLQAFDGSTLPFGIVDVKLPPYSAVGDGVADDTGAIQAAMNSVAGGGGIVYFPAGTYRTLSLTPGSKTTLVGTGRGSTLLFVDDGTLTSRQLYIHNVTDVVVRDLAITSTATSRTGVYGLIRIEGSSRVSVLNTTLLVSPATAVHAIHATDLLIEGNTVQGTFADGIHISRQSTRVRISNNTISNTGDDGIGLVSYTDNPQAWTDNENITVVGNTIQNVNVGRGIAVYGGRNIVVDGNTVADIDQAGIIVSATGGALSTSTTHFPKQVVVSNNTVRNTGRNIALGTVQGIYVNPGRFIHVEDNIVETTAGDGITLAGVTKDITVANNTVSRAAGRSIIVDATASTDARLIQELFTDLGETGLTTALSASIVITGNHVRRGAAALIHATMASPNLLLGLVCSSNIVEDSLTATEGIQVFRVREAAIHGNRIYNCALAGIRIATSDHVACVGNVVTLCPGAGVLLVGSIETLVSGNILTDDVVGLLFDATSNGNSATGNLFFNNATNDIQNDGANNSIGGNQLGTAGSAFTIANLAALTTTNFQLNNFAQIVEILDPGPADANSGRLYVRHSGGKSQLVIRFPTGAIQVIATEP